MNGVTGRARYDVDIDKGVRMEPMGRIFASSDVQALTLEIRVYQSGVPADLSGSGVVGYFMRADQSTVVITGTAAGNTALLTLPESCYAVDGGFQVFIKATGQSGNETRTTVFAGQGYVTLSSTDRIIDPGEVIPSLDDLLARIAEIESVTRNANSAAESANTAAQRASEQADSIAGLTVSAHDVGPDGEAGVTKTHVDGYIHLDFALKQGETGKPGEQGPPGTDGEQGAPGKDGTNGVTFTPAVSPEGELTWTNDGERDNPDPVNIKGPQGAPGKDGEPGPAGENGADGLPGPKGDDGKPGKDGTTFTPSVSEDGELSWTNDGNLPNPDPVNIRGPRGEPGTNGKDGEDGRDGRDGEPGADGLTPEIGEGGNWYIGGVDTGKPSRGEPGKDGTGVKTVAGIAPDDAGNVALKAHDIGTLSDEEIESLWNHTYAGRDLTQVHAEEIADYGGDVWTMIKERCKKKDWSGLRVGDYIPFTLPGGTQVDAQISGIDTYYGYGDTPVPHHIDFISREVWPENIKMNLVDYNNGISDAIESPWLCSNAYAYLNSLKMDVPNGTTAPVDVTTVDYTQSGVYSRLPDSLKAVIVPKHVLAPIRYSTGEVLNLDNLSKWMDYGNLWLPSELEITGHPVYSVGSDIVAGFVQYPLFSHSYLHRCKTSLSGLYKLVWWTSVAASYYSSAFVAISVSGQPSLHNSTEALGAPVCFRIAA